jgi:predicted lipoprotein with Yx(FWY)xxD motif
MKPAHPLFAKPAFTAGVALLSFTLLLAACAPSGASAQGLYGNPAAPTGTASSAAPTAPATGSGSVQVAQNAKFGQILVTSSGLTLYTFDLDQVAVSRCESTSCVAYWPPYIASAQPTGGAQIAARLGLIVRPDGRMQVTYNEMPLYTFIADKQPGDVNGDGVNQFGALWHVVVVGAATGQAAP